MKIDLLEIITDAKKIYFNSRYYMGMCASIRFSIIDYERKYLFGKASSQNRSYVEYIEDHIKETVHKPPKHYYPLKARFIVPFSDGYWWKLNDFKSRLKRFDEYIEYFSKPENRYLEV